MPAAIGRCLSLASLMTGKYPCKHRINELISYFGGDQREQNLAFLLRKMGYKTGMVWSNPLACPWTITWWALTRYSLRVP